MWRRRRCLLHAGDGGTNRLYLLDGKQAPPPADPPLAFVDSSAAQLDSLLRKGSENAGQGEWSQAAGPDGILSWFTEAFV